MKKIIYASIFLAGFLFNHFYENCNQKAKLQLENHQYFLEYEKIKYPLTINNNKPQLGTVEYRLEGLLNESYEELKYSLDKIIQKNYDSTLISRTSSKD